MLFAEDLPLAQVAEQLFEDAVVASARCRRRARHGVDDLAVLHAVVGDPLHRAARREIDRDDLAVRFLRQEESRLRLRARDIIICLPVADDGRGGRRTEVHANLLLAHAGRDLLKVALVELSAVLQHRVVAGGKWRHRRQEQRKSQACLHLSAHRVTVFPRID